MGNIPGAINALKIRGQALRKEVGEQLREGRLRADFTQVEVSVIFSIPQSEVSKIERGLKGADFVLVCNMAALYGISLVPLLPQSREIYGLLKTEAQAVLAKRKGLTLDEHLRKRKATRAK